MHKSGAIAGGMLGAAAVMIAALLATAPPAMEAPRAAAPAAGGAAAPAQAAAQPPAQAAAQAQAQAPAPAPGGAPPLVEIFERTEAGTVRVEVRRDGAAFDRNGVGSGFVFDRSGHVITNAHVVDGAGRVVVTFLDGRSYVAEVAGADSFTDIAVLRVDAGRTELVPLMIGDSAGLRVGEQIAAIGNPFGLSGSMTSGIVSQLGRLLPTQDGPFQIPDVIQTDAAINPGNSGGPLLNMRGEVVGINTAIRSATGEFAGVGFAVPSQTLAKIVPALIRDGEYRHPWMGISGRDIGPDLAGVLGLSDARGFLVVEVVPGGPAAAAGLRGSPATVERGGERYPVGGDVIVSVDGADVRKIDDILVHLQRQKAVGDAVELGVVRDGRAASFALVLGERPDT